MSIETIMEWHNDGHSVSLMLNKSAVLIDSISCPAVDKKAACYSDVINGCVVEWFLSRYGLDCNVGVVPASAEMEIAWTASHDSPYDTELWQVWFIPTADEIFSAWLSSQNGDSSSSAD